MSHYYKKHHIKPDDIQLTHDKQIAETSYTEGDIEESQQKGILSKGFQRKFHHEAESLEVPKSITNHEKINDNNESIYAGLSSRDQELIHKSEAELNKLEELGEYEKEFLKENHPHSSVMEKSSPEGDIEKYFGESKNSINRSYKPDDPPEKKIVDQDEINKEANKILSDYYGKEWQNEPQPLDFILKSGKKFFNEASNFLQEAKEKIEELIPEEESTSAHLLTWDNNNELPKIDTIASEDSKRLEEKRIFQNKEKNAEVAQDINGESGQSLEIKDTDQKQNAIFQAKHQQEFLNL